MDRTHMSGFAIKLFYPLLRPSWHSSGLALAFLENMSARYPNRGGVPGQTKSGQRAQCILRVLEISQNTDY